MGKSGKRDKSPKNQAKSIKKEEQFEGDEQNTNKKAAELPPVSEFPAIELLKRISPKLPSRTGISTIFSYLWEFNQGKANIMKLNKAARQFVTTDAIANGVDLLDVVCYRDNLGKEKVIEIQRLLKSIKILGPQCPENETLMEIPNRKILRDIIIDKVRNGWKTEKEESEN